MHKGPQFIHTPIEEQGGVGHFKTPMRPLSAVDERLESNDHEKGE